MREVVEKDEKDEAESLGLSGLQAHPIHFLSSHNTFISSLPSPSYKLPLSPPLEIGSLPLSLLAALFQADPLDLGSQGAKKDHPGKMCQHPVCLSL